MLRGEVGYNELGVSYYDERNKEHIRKHAVKRLRAWASKSRLRVLPDIRSPDAVHARLSGCYIPFIHTCSRKLGACLIFIRVWVS